MGCDIHLITQIKKDNKWEYVKDVPESLNDRNYYTFSIIAGVRDNFGSQLFEVKGLPKDIGEMKVGWESDLENIRKVYNKGTDIKCLLPNGEYISPFDSRLSRKCTKEEHDNWEGSKSQKSSSSGVEYYVDDASVLNGKIVDVRYKDIYTFEEYLKEYHEDDYDSTMNDYGSWAVDFSDEGLHTPSYLTLEELKEKDYSSLYCEKCKVLKCFADEFIRLGGVLPKGMEFEEDKPGDIVECLRFAMSPTVIVKWEDFSKKDIALFDGIKELENIAKKYNITNYEDIRIVFAFDN